jgi:hypothetical protein
MRRPSLPFDHQYEEYSALVPPANPAHAPTIDSIAEGRGLEQPQELGLHLHGNINTGCSAGGDEGYVAPTSQWGISSIGAARGLQLGSSGTDRICFVVLTG